MKSRLLALAALTLAMACESTRQPTGITAPTDPSKVIRDGAHGGNKDFWWLPPLVPLPLNNPDFQLGTFNNALRASLKVVICELKSENFDSQGLPTDATGCNATIKTFAPGSVNLVNLPLQQNGWWTLFNLPPDGFYYVLWDTRQSTLDVNKFYRIKVLIDGSDTPLGIADVDPMANIFQWRFTRTGSVVQLVDDVLLPIPFRIEHGGGSPLCGGSNLCTSKTITNSDPSGFQSLTLEGGAGSIAGASFPNGWIPAGGPPSVVVTIAQVTVAGGGSTTDPTPCHVGLALPQYKGCFRFTTTPALPPDPETGAEFAQRVRVAVCYELDGTGGLERFAELWSSGGPNEQPHPLDDATDAGLLGAASRNCNTTPPVIGSTNSNPLVQLASAGWSRIKSGVRSVFGIKTAYAVDLGLGGFTDGFSNVSPVRTQEIVASTPTVLSSVAPGATITDTARVIGSNHHTTHTLVTGIGGVDVTFTVAAGNGCVLPLGCEGPGSNQVTVTTNTNPIDGSPVSGGGFAPVNWTLPTTPGTYTLTANAAALGGPVTYTATVTSPAVSIDGIIGAGEWADATVYGPYTVNLPGGAQTTATIYLKNNATQLFGAVRFGQDLSNQDDVILALMMDLNANAVWDNNEDGFVVHQRIGGASSNTFFDEYALCTPLNVCNEAIDTQNGGTNDGSTASTDGGPPTSVEFVKGINTPDALDAHLVAGQTLRFFFFTNIGTGPSGRAETYYPSRTTTASYTVR